MSPAAAVAIQGSSAPAVAAIAPVQAEAPVASVSIIAERPVKADTTVTPVAAIQADTAVAAVKADAPISAISAIADVFEERGTVLLGALAEGGGRNGLAAGRGASDQSRSERRPFS